MRKALCMLSLAAVATLTIPPAQAAPYGDEPDPATPAEATVGVVGGTVIGLGVSEGWWGATVAEATLPTTAAGATAIGGVAGIGAVAAIDSVVQPCKGFHALFNLSDGQCVSGHYVGYAPRRYYRRHG